MPLPRWAGALLLAVALGTLLALAGAAVGPAAPAGAHATLLTTDPAGGARVADSPPAVTVSFDEPVRADRDALRVLDSSGRRVDSGPVEELDGGRTLRVPIRDLDEGTYVTTWRVVSTDSHPVSGGVAWSVGQGDAAPGAIDDILAAAEGSGTVERLADVARGVLFGAVLVLTGGWAFLLLLWPAGVAQRRVRWLLGIAAGLAVLATLAGLGLQGAEVGGLDPADALRPSVAADVLDSEYGEAALLRLGALVVAVAAVAGLRLGRPDRLRSTAAQAIAALVVIALLSSLTLSGHARAGRWVPLAVAADLLHLLAAAAWIGGLAVLLVGVLPLPDPARVQSLAARFSPIAFGAVAVLVATGAVQAVRQVDPLGDITRTDFGRLLLLKLAAVAILVGLAAYSRSVVRARWAGEDDPTGDEGRRTLRQGVAAEVVLAVAVVAVTSVLVATNPSDASVTTPFAASRSTDDVVVDVTVTPALPGRNTVHLYVTAVGASLTTAVEVTARASLPDRDVDVIEVPLQPSGRNHWTSEAAQFPVKGDWDLEVRVRVGEFEESAVLFTVPIG